MSRVSILGTEIDNLSLNECLDEIQKILKTGKPSYLATPNVAHILLLRKDEKFRKIYSDASLVLADGMPLIWAAKLLGSPLKEKCSGSDLFEKVCQIGYSLDRNIFLLGGQNGSEKIAESQLSEKYSGIKVSSYSPPFGFENNPQENIKIIKMINDFNTSILIVCVGAPKSEKWIYQNISNLDINLACPFGISLDFFAGTKKRAPLWMQKSGLEWFFRLIQEPGRLWKRYLIGNTIFIYLLIKELIKSLFVKGSVKNKMIKNERIA